MESFMRRMPCTQATSYYTLPGRSLRGQSGELHRTDMEVRRADAFAQVHGVVAVKLNNRR